MKFRVFLTGLLLAVSATAALADQPYIGFAGGVSFFRESDLRAPGEATITAAYDSGKAFSLSVGSRFDWGRFEGEFGYRTAGIDTLSAYGYTAGASGVDVTVKSYMLNGYYDFNREATITPFLGGGVGLMNYEMKGNGSTEDANAIGYQLIAGMGINLNKTLTIDLSYRFQGAASDFEKDGEKISYTSSSILGGLRVNF